MQLKDKVMIVTGATSGIGEAVAKAAAAAGARLMLTGRSAERGERVRMDCGAAAQLLSCDITQAGFAERLVDETVRRWGRLDILVNNAGVIHRHTAETATDEEWDHVMAVNVTAVFRLSRAAIRVMKRNGGGVIVNIGSDWALVGGRNAFAYCVSKGAVAQMTRAMALDHAHENIRVNCVCPGEIDTPMTASGIAHRGLTHEQGLKLLAAEIPLGRVARPDEIAKAVLFLASDDSSFMTGAMMSVDGGSTAA
ncbi:MAG TPA: glucose 1-dehydrogenase [Alphaproteobacteria bacterium]|jgi:NAD(P)-dependent dehydrogenase (short-subunit alcohol dehydrogenase family)|nr:glucose 1-dehydrogenase [Alphaproteobacteria bacterium]